MKLEDQVVSLELAKRLKELGVEQESLFYWTHCPRGIDLVHQRSRMKKALSKYDFAAFTVAELGEMLPTRVNKSKYDMLMSRREGRRWFAYYTDQKTPVVSDESEANARARLLIYLLENKLMEVPNA
jgi:Fe-S oxidoreductase